MKTQPLAEAISTSVVEFLKAKNCLDLLPEVIKRLIQSSWSAVDPHLAIVSSPVALSSAQKQTLRTSLSKKFRQPIKLKTKTDSSIIAGLKIEFSGRVIDLTVNQRLQDLKSSLIYD